MMRAMDRSPPTTDGIVTRAEASWNDAQELTLYYGGSIVVQLGAQLYPSVTASVAELISNAWDADARHAWVTIPVRDAWHEDAVIEVLDDGVGMTRKEAQFRYLVVGRERRREERTDETERQRKLHGRKGIGKLAAFGTGHLLEVVTKKAGCPAVGFRLDYQKLRDHEPGESSPVEEIRRDEIDALVDPDGQALDHGTRVRLTRLQNKRQPNPDRLVDSMRRRFAFDEHEMRVEINGELLTRFDMTFPIRFPPDGHPSDCHEYDDRFVVDLVDDGTGNRKPVRWWIGFTDKPVRHDNVQGVTVLVHGKQAQRAFKFERTGGTQGQLGFEYLVGEVHADWIDDGWDDEGDLISSDRDALQLEDERLQPFVKWGRARLQWALRQWEEQRRAKRSERWQMDMPQVADVLGQTTMRERQTLGRVAERLSRVSGINDGDIAEVMDRVLQAREHHTARQVADEIRSVGDAIAEDMWVRARDAREIERRVLSAAVDVRIAVLEALVDLLEGVDRPPNIGQVLADYPWVIDMAFDRSSVSVLESTPPGTDAMLVVGGAPWAEDERGGTLVAAAWPTEPQGFDEEAWAARISEIAIPQTDRRLLIGPRTLAGTVRSWGDVLTRSIVQHKVWRQTLTESDR